ncbi:hypothetical protein PBS_39280 [Paraburkholderia sp. 2C]
MREFDIAIERAIEFGRRDRHDRRRRGFACRAGSGRTGRVGVFLKLRLRRRIFRGGERAAASQ